MGQLAVLNENEWLADEVAILKPLGKPVVADFIRSGRFRLDKFTPGTTIHFENDICHKMEIILTGEIIIERTDAFGNLMTVAHCYRNDVLGGNLLFSRNPHYPMTLMAVRDTVLLSLDKSIVFELLSEYPPFLQKYLELSADRANVLGDQIRHYVNKTIRVCLVTFIKLEYEQQKTNPIHLNLSKKKLAEKIGVQRTSISRELAKMRQESLVLYDKNTLTILDTSILI